METDSRTDADTTSLETHQEKLETENITFVDDPNDKISAILEKTPDLQYDYVLGDVSDYGISGNGHAHFDLVHEGATIHCVIFSYRFRSLDVELDEETHIAVKGDLSFYEANGSVSLIVEDFVEIGEGKYQQTYQENKPILKEDGLIDEEVGAVTYSTSTTGASAGDKTMTDSENPVDVQLFDDSRAGTSLITVEE